jgi:F-box/leucine-rich repeat protein 2/20
MSRFDWIHIFKLGICNFTVVLMLFIHLQNVTDDAVQEIGDHCHQILFLCLSNCSRLTDTSLVSLGQGCHNLT